MPGPYTTPSVEVNADGSVITSISGEVDTVTAQTIGGAKTFTGVATFTNQLRESAVSPLTAFAGGGQASATPLTGMFNRVTTTAATTAPFDSVLLPASAAGLDIVVVNATANPVQVFGAGTDTVNGLASITQAPNSVETYFCTAAGLWSVDPAVGYAGQLMTLLTIGGITANAAGTQAAATPLTAEINRVTTAANTAAPYSSVLLPPSAPGLDVIVVNASANPMQVYGAGTDSINGVAATVGITQPPSSIETYICPAAGVWNVDPGIGFSGQLFTELAQDGIVARAGGGSASATQLVAQTSRIATVATVGDSVKLPASAAGLELMVINHGANAMQVFGTGADTIDDVAAATGVSQMTQSLVIYTCATAGAWYSEGLATGYGGPGLQTSSFTGGLTATAGGGQAGALTLTSMVNRVTTVATPGDSVKLPASAAGLMITVINRGANPMQIFGSGTDTINGIAFATGLSLAANSVSTFTCGTTGLWDQGDTGFVHLTGAETIAGAKTLTGLATFTGHVAATGTAPAVAAGANNGTTPPAPTDAGANDTRGIIAFGSGATPAAGAQVAATFNVAYASAPVVTLTAGNSTTQALGLYVSAVTTTGFTVSSATAPTASQAAGTYSAAFTVIG